METKRTAQGLDSRYSGVTQHGYQIWYENIRPRVNKYEHGY